MPEEYGATLTVHVPSYRGIENPFGHVWSWTDGILVQAQSDADGAKHLFFRAADDNPANFNSSNYNGYVQRGELPRSDGYVKKILCGEYGDNMPQQIGGSSTTYFADYFYQNILLSEQASKRRSLKGRVFRRSCDLRRVCRACVCVCGLRPLEYDCVYRFSPLLYTRSVRRPKPNERQKRKRLTPQPPRHYLAAGVHSKTKNKKFKKR